MNERKKMNDDILDGEPPNWRNIITLLTACVLLAVVALFLFNGSMSPHTPVVVEPESSVIKTEPDKSLVNKNMAPAKVYDMLEQSPSKPKRSEKKADRVDSINKVEKPDHQGKAISSAAPRSVGDIIKSHDKEDNNKTAAEKTKRRETTDSTAQKKPKEKTAVASVDKTPTAKPSTASDKVMGRYVLQLASYNEATTARAAFQKSESKVKSAIGGNLGAHGWSYKVVAAMANGKKVFRLQVTGFESKAIADEQCAKIKKRLGKGDCLVLKNS